MDGSLLALGGHPHDIDLRSTQALVNAGHDVHVYCHVDANDELKSHYSGIAPITAIFTINPYKSQASYDTFAGDIVKNLDGAHTTARELAKARDADIWLWPSLYPHQLLACSLIKTNALVSGCIHHTPDFFSAADTGWWRYGFIRAHGAGLKLRLGAIEQETSYLYSPLTIDGKFHTFPFPNDGSKNIKLHHAGKKIGFFGAQRHEKGIVFMHALLKKLVADGYEVILHDSNTKNRKLNDIEGITLLGHVMDLDEEIAKCDLVVTPYNADSYRHRGSGIVMSAIASGVPVVTPYGSAPGRLIEKTGAGTLFVSFTLDSIYAAIQSAVKNYPTIAQAAFDAGSHWKEKHGLNKFLDAMIL
jgi:glycosyltransferase involved in cell wall biosynthesis